MLKRLRLFQSPTGSQQPKMQRNSLHSLISTFMLFFSGRVQLKKREFLFFFFMDWWNVVLTWKCRSREPDLKDYRTNKHDKKKSKMLSPVQIHCKLRYAWMQFRENIKKFCSFTLEFSWPFRSVVSYWLSVIMTNFHRTVQILSIVSKLETRYQRRINHTSHRATVPTIFSSCREHVIPSFQMDVR